MQETVPETCRCGTKFRWWIEIDGTRYWYWCLECDQHVSGCKSKGTVKPCCLRRRS